MNNFLYRSRFIFEVQASASYGRWESCYAQYALFFTYLDDFLIYKKLISFNIIL